MFHSENSSLTRGYTMVYRYEHIVSIRNTPNRSGRLHLEVDWSSFKSKNQQQSTTHLISIHQHPSTSINIHQHPSTSIIIHQQPSTSINYKTLWNPITDQFSSILINQHPSSESSHISQKLCLGNEPRCFSNHKLCQEKWPPLPTHMGSWGVPGRPSLESRREGKSWGLKVTFWGWSGGRDISRSYVTWIYPLVMTNSLPWKDPPFLIGKPW